MEGVPVKMHLWRREGLLNFETTPIPSHSSSSIGVVTNFPKDSSTPPSPCSSSKISPALLFVIVVLAVLFFISGLLHLLLRLLTKTPSTPDRASEASASASLSSNALQRQLQQLFHLHDSGLDQAFIDALPVFTYTEIIGLQEHFDCAVCLCEFLDVDKLRLLPMCGHAFHMSCIDTWLLSNSTCPICRGTPLSPGGLSIGNPVFDFDDLMEDDIDNIGLPNATRKRVEMDEAVVEKGGFPVRLGKFKKVNNDDSGGGDEIVGSSKLDSRRCYSMGSYQYVVGNGDLRVVPDESGKKISIGTKTDSYSVSKIWLWSKRTEFGSSSWENDDNVVI